MGHERLTLRSRVVEVARRERARLEGILRITANARNLLSQLKSDVLVNGGSVIRSRILRF